MQHEWVAHDVLRWFDTNYLPPGEAKVCYCCTTFGAAACFDFQKLWKVADWPDFDVAIQGRVGKVNIATIALVVVILASYIVGTLTSSVDTERELPHRF
jgi:hypothetical protein